VDVAVASHHKQNSPSRTCKQKASKHVDAISSIALTQEINKRHAYLIKGETHILLIKVYADVTHMSFRHNK
jgi:hypothetical protein